MAKRNTKNEWRSRGSWQTERQDECQNTAHNRAGHTQPWHSIAHQGTSRGPRSCEWRHPGGSARACTSQVNQSTPEESYYNQGRVSQSWLSRTKGASRGSEAASWRNQGAGDTVSTLRENQSTSNKLWYNQGAGGPKNWFPGRDSPRPLNYHASNDASRTSQAYSWRNQGANAIPSTSQENQLPTLVEQVSSQAVPQNTPQHDIKTSQDAYHNQGCSLQYQSVIQQNPLSPAHHDARSVHSSSSSSYYSLDGDVDSDSSSSATSSSESLTNCHETPIRIPEPTSSAIQQAVFYTHEDTIFFKLMKIIYTFVKQVLYLIFKEETKDRPPSMPLLTYFEENGVKVNVFKKNLNDQQKRKIQNDHEGKTFDISLLFLCIQYWCNRFTDGNGETWKEGIDTFESHLTTLKNKRNELIHDELEFNRDTFARNVKVLRKLFTKTLQCAEVRYKLPRDSVRKIVDNMNENIKYLRDQPLKSHVFEHSWKEDLRFEKLKFAQVIKKTLGELCAKFELDISMYQDLPIKTAELLDFEKLSVCENTKLKIIESVRASSIRKPEDWLTFLAAVKYDEFVAAFVCRQPDICEGHIRINDSTILAYISLFRALRAPVSEVILSISTERMLFINDLLKEINNKKLSVMSLRFHEDFRSPKARVIEEDALNEIFDRCPVRVYVGAFTENIQLPPTVTRLKISIISEASCDHLNEYLASYKGSLALCLPKLVYSVSLKPILATDHLPDLYIPDVESAKEAVDRVKKLKSVSGKLPKVGKLLFPRCSLNVQDLEDLISELHKEKVQVCSFVSFPKYTKPKYKDDVNALQAMVKTKLGCQPGIVWGLENIDTWQK